MPDDAIPLNNGWFAVDLGNNLYEIFSENGTPLGFAQLKDGESIEDWEDYDSLIPLGGLSEEPIKNNPGTGDRIIFVLLGLLLVCGCAAIIARKKNVGA